jgi:hypothetical protein
MCDIIRCPLCEKNYEGMNRYPNAVCNDCINLYNTYDKNGNNIKFANIDECGGVRSITTIGNTEIEGNECQCFINGNECTVEDSRFGGIVISCIKITPPNKRQKR